LFAGAAAEAGGSAGWSGRIQHQASGRTARPEPSQRLFGHGHGKALYSRLDRCGRDQREEVLNVVPRGSRDGANAPLPREAGEGNAGPIGGARAHPPPPPPPPPHPPTAPHPSPP